VEIPLLQCLALELLDFCLFLNRTPKGAFPMRPLASLLIFLILVPVMCAQAQKKSTKVAPTSAKADLGDFDSFVNQALKDWKVPGVAVAVVQYSARNGGSFEQRRRGPTLQLCSNDLQTELKLAILGAGK
jgi:hypothetical protein